MRFRGADRRGSRELTKKASPTLAQQFQALVASKGGSTFDASRYTPSGGNIANFVCGVDATHTLTVTGTIAAPTAEATLGNALAASFTAAQRATSNKPASFFKCLHDGTGGNLFVALTPTDTSNRCIVATRPISTLAENGFFLLHGYGSAQRLGIGSTAAAIVDVTFGSAATANVGMLMSYSYAESSSPKVTARKSGSANNTSAPTGSPDAGDPVATLVLGATSAGSFLSNMRWAQLHFVPGVLSAPELALIHSYMQATTGVTP